MILSDRKIKEEMSQGNITIGNYVEKHINPNSYDMTLAPTCKVYVGSAIHDITSLKLDENKTLEYLEFKQYCKALIELDCKKSNRTFEFNIPEEGFVLQPNHLYLYGCNETIGVKGTICATVMGKSSLGRLGLDIHVCAGFVDSGFEGSLVLEMRTIYPLRIYPNQKICQIKFERVEGIVEESYDKKEGSKYHKQEGVVASKYEQNFK